VEQLLKVISELPENTSKIDIEYDFQKRKIVIFPSDEEDNNSNRSVNKNIDGPKKDPNINPDDDLTKYL
jgi:hypothetical protein